jgi:FdhD protein
VTATPDPPVGRRKRVARARTTVSTPAGAAERVDRLAVEEPLEIRVEGPGQEPAGLSVTMRTPGDDFELAAGFLVTEGLATGEEIERVAYCLSGDGRQEYNVVTVRLRRRWDPDVTRRNFYASSSCGICGKATLDQVEVHCRPIPPGPPVARDVLLGLPDRLRAAQTVFEQTGGLHAAALFDAGGELLALREDIGRHNALDKLVGRAALAGELPLHGRILLVSGRTGFEIVQKAAVAGIPVVGAVSAPSSLAVDAAQRFGITLVGFLRGDRFNVYAHPEGVDLA